METRVGVDRAKGIIDRLPFDGSVHTDTIGFSGGIWMLWDSERVEVTPLANIEQEIHATVKVRNTNSAGFLLLCMLVLERLRDISYGIILFKLLVYIICRGLWRVILMNLCRRRINLGEEQ